jgi:hypothetical protein
LDGSELSHSGDGAFFYNPYVPKISEGRAVTMDYDGNLRTPHPPDFSLIPI